MQGESKIQAFKTFGPRMQTRKKLNLSSCSLRLPTEPGLIGWS